MQVVDSTTAVVAQKRRRTDVVVCATLAVVAVITGAAYLGAARRAALPFLFYQAEFGPAVMEACGLGFVNPSADPLSPLGRFLDQQTSRLDCAELGTIVQRGPFTRLQFSMRYLLLCSAWVWKITGIRWQALDVIGAVFIAATVALVYLFYRLLLPAWLSAGLALIWLTSPVHLYSLTSLRDYAKAPFFVLTVLVVATIVLRPLTSPRLIGISAFLGAALGVGFGFRTDVALNLAPFAVALMLLEASGVVRRVGTRAAAFVVCCAMFIVCARPAFKAYEGGHGLWHVSLLGLMDPFDEPLRISPSIYSFGNAYSDHLIETTVSSYASRVQPYGAEP
ncbi:MAG TPA: hypothetical protein VLV86_10360, partial [Vicinamibacterales bacterium]|nr:hypothetical protein [Vicinamibacterales bacterium]